MTIHTHLLLICGLFVALAATPSLAASKKTTQQTAATRGDLILCAELFGGCRQYRMKPGCRLTSLGGSAPDTAFKVVCNNKPN